MKDTKSSYITARMDGRTLEHVQSQLGAANLSTVTRRLLIMWSQSEDLQREVLLLNRDSISDLDRN